MNDKIPFRLEAAISEVSGNSSEAELIFSGEFNAMMAMMIKGPISKFLDTLTTQLENS